MARVVWDLAVLPATHAFIRERYEMNHAFAFAVEAGPHFTDHGWMEGGFDLVGWLYTQNPRWFTGPNTSRARC